MEKPLYTWVGAILVTEDSVRFSNMLAQRPSLTCACSTLFGLMPVVYLCHVPSKLSLCSDHITAHMMAHLCFFGRHIHMCQFPPLPSFFFPPPFCHNLGAPAWPDGMLWLEPCGHFRSWMACVPGTPPWILNTLPIYDISFLLGVLEKNHCYVNQDHVKLSIWYSINVHLTHICLYIPKYFFTKFLYIYSILIILLLLY